MENTAYSLPGHVTEILSPSQQKLVDTVQKLQDEPITVAPKCSARTDEQIHASLQIHKRINPGYVDMPCVSSSQEQFTYMPAPDFTRDYLRSSSDCKFQEFAAEALKHGMKLGKTGH